MVELSFAAHQVFAGTAATLSTCRSQRICGVDRVFFSQEPVASRSTAQSSPMKTSSTSTLALAFFPWPTQARTPTAHSFSYAPSRPSGEVLLFLSGCHQLPLHIHRSPFCIPVHLCPCFCNSLPMFIRRLDGKHVVFGQVVKGLEVVKALEAVGSQSGKTSKPVSLLSQTHCIKICPTCACSRWGNGLRALHTCSRNASAADWSRNVVSGHDIKIYLALVHVSFAS